jgi:alpha-galactosidase
MVASGLRDAGYRYINLDDGWAISRDNNGTIVADPKLFPHGMKAVVDYIHSRGLLFGIYTARGSRTCLGRPGSDGFEQQDADYYAMIGVDYLKEDSCGGTVHGSVWDQYSRMRDALNRTQRPIYYSITQAMAHPDKPPIAAMHCYGDSAFTVKNWLVEGKDPRSLANSFLIEYCNNLDFFGFTGGVPHPGGMLSQLDSQALLTFDNMTTEGAYNDMDMLHVCNGGQTHMEYQSQFSLWAVLASPLILGNDIRSMDADCKAIVLNREIIAISQVS